MIRLTSLLALLVACNGPEDTGPVVDDDTGETCTPDADGDGWCPPEDCDDNRELTHPGALEVPYNGHDDDCDGEDLCDFDADGYDSEHENCGGDDCNDGNPKVYPGAPEPCYPDMDYNCDGIVSEDDCDLDGYPKQDDCNDEDPEIYPDAPDEWYDGVDSNCHYDSDFDQDVDSDELEWQDDWPDPDWPDKIPVWDPDWDDGLKIKYVDAPTDPEEWEGMDCVDTDPLTGGGLKELWDGEDRDCDGLVDELSNRDAWKGYDSSGGVADYAWGAGVTLLGDLDGDGYAEFAAGDLGAGATNYDGRVYVVPSGPEDGRPSDLALATIDVASSASGASYLMGWAVDTVGDINKDGRPELLVGVPLYDGYGASLVFDGADLDDGALDTSDAYATLYDETYLNGLDNVGIADLNNDSMKEIASGSSFYDYFYLGVWSGARVGQGGQYASSQALSVITDEASPGGAIGSGDFDGDGLGDVLASALSPADSGAAGTVYLYDGDAIRSGSAAALGDADLSFSGSSCLGSSFGTMEDVDGDGYPEALIADLCAAGLDGNPMGGIAYVVDGDELWSLSDIESAAHFVVEAENGYGCLKVERRSADHDGDGTPDLMVGEPGTVEIYGSLQGTWTPSGTGWVHWYPGSEVAAGGSVTTADSTADFRGLNDGSTFGISWDVGAIDGEDEYPDIAIGQAFAGTGKVYLFQNLIY